jgi:hypothetical protein
MQRFFLRDDDVATNRMTLVDDLNTYEKCRQLLEDLSWPNGVQCLRCGSKSINEELVDAQRHIVMTGNLIDRNSVEQNIRPAATCHSLAPPLRCSRNRRYPKIC